MQGRQIVRFLEISRVSVDVIIWILGRNDSYGHYTPITHAITLSRGVFQREFYVEDIGEKTTRLDPDRIISKGW